MYFKTQSIMFGDGAALRESGQEDEEPNRAGMQIAPGAKNPRLSQVLSRTAAGRQ
ncbi:MAG: hypothetical protein H6R26_220 [Proteobacteria bacterium]|nr:hypothetical protein [Pseudomonadota bacterium]